MLFALFNALRFVFGPLFVLCGFIGTGMGVMTIIDPVGAKAADDIDPHGTPPTLWEGISLTLIFFTILLLGVWLLVSRRWKRSAQQVVPGDAHPQDRRGRG